MVTLKNIFHLLTAKEGQKKIEINIKLKIFLERYAQVNTEKKVIKDW